MRSVDLMLGCAPTVIVSSECQAGCDRGGGKRVSREPMRTGEVLGVVPANQVSGPETGHSEEYRPFLVAERFHTHWD